mgnify:CR=1 FL=1
MGQDARIRSLRAQARAGRDSDDAARLAAGDALLDADGILRAEVPDGTVVPR